jgi:hypothetical protein
MKLDAENNQPPPAVRRRARRCRISGWVILAAGLIGAGMVYWLGTRGPDYSDNPEMAGFNRSEERQMGMLYGKQGQLLEDFDNWLKQPGTQAILIVAAAAMVAAGCFYFARILEAEAIAAAVEPPPVD